MKSSFIISLFIFMFGLIKANSRENFISRSELDRYQNVTFPVHSTESQGETINAIFQLVYRASTGRNNEPVEISYGMKVYYVFNKNGVALMAVGSTLDRALYDISGGIREGRIKVGSYTLSGYKLRLEWKSGNSVTHEYSSATDEIYISDEVKLVKVKSLD